MKKLIVAIVLSSLLVGCGTLIPKRVEFFQDKVKAYPEPKEKEKEIQRQAATKAAEVSLNTLLSAVGENASTNVTNPAKDAVVLTEAVKQSLGPPKAPSTENAVDLAVKLDAAIAKLNARIDDFKKDVNENAGKKIEGTGLFSVPYFVWLGIVLVLGFFGILALGVLWTIFKMYAASNPPLQLGVNAVQAGAGFFKKALVEVAKGGENFKKRIETEISDPVVAAKVKQLFQIEHERAQSTDVQSVVQAVTKKI